MKETPRESLHLAAESGDLEKLQALLEAGADPNATDSNGQTALHSAACYGHQEILDALLEAGADPNAKNSKGQTALHFAAFYEHPKIVDELLKKGIEFNAKDTSGKTALYLAASRGNEKTLHVLLKYGVELNSQDDSGQTALHSAALFGHLQIVIMLRKAGANDTIRDVDGMDFFGRATRQIQDLLNRVSVLSNAINENNYALVQQILTKGSLPVNALGDLLIFANIKATSDIVDILKNARALSSISDSSGANDTQEVGSLQKRSKSQLDRTIIGHNDLLVQDILKSKNFSGVWEGVRLLHLAASNSTPQIVRTLLNAGANPWIKDSTGNDAYTFATKEVKKLLKKLENFHNAVSEGNLEIVRSLLEEGGLPLEALGPKGKTALETAVIEGHLEVIGALWRAGADVTPDLIDMCARHAEHKKLCEFFQGIGNNNHLTNRYADKIPYVWYPSAYADALAQPLYEAVSKKNAVEARIFLGAGANPNAKDEKCQTALHRIALFIGKEESVDLLQAFLRAGADVDAKNAQGQTALHLAASKKNLEVANELLQGCADVDTKNAQGQTALHIAASVKGGEKAACALLAAGADVDAKNAQGQTALHIAASKGDVEVVNALLAAGADVDAKDAQGQTALHIAAAVKGGVEAVRALLAAGADFKIKNAQGKTALNNANREVKELFEKLEQLRRAISSSTCTAKTVNYLLDTIKIPLRAISFEGQPALHLAAKSGDPEKVRLLLEKGADLYATNSKGQTALDVACEAHSQQPNPGESWEKVVNELLTPPKDLEGQALLDWVENGRRQLLIPATLEGQQTGRSYPGSASQSRSGKTFKHAVGYIQRVQESLDSPDFRTF